MSALLGLCELQSHLFIGSKRSPSRGFFLSLSAGIGAATRSKNLQFYRYQFSGNVLMAAMKVLPTSCRCRVTTVQLNAPRNQYTCLLGFPTTS